MMTHQELKIWKQLSVLDFQTFKLFKCSLYILDRGMSSSFSFVFFPVYFVLKMAECWKKFPYFAQMTMRHSVVKLLVVIFLIILQTKQLIRLRKWQKNAKNMNKWITLLRYWVSLLPLSSMQGIFPKHTNSRFKSFLPNIIFEQLRQFGGI